MSFVCSELDVFSLSELEMLPADLMAAARLCLRSGKVLCARQGETPAGILLLTRRSTVLEVPALYVAPAQRRRGCALALVQHARALAAQSAKPLLLHFFADSPDADAFAALAEKAGLAAGKDAFLYVFCPRSAPHLAQWHAFCSRRGDALLQRFAARGVTAVSFAQGGPALTAQLRRTAQPFPPFLFDPNAVAFHPAFSFIAVQNGQALAFCTASQHGQRLILEQLCSRADVCHKGLFLPPLLAFIDAGVRAGMDRITFLCDSENREMLRMGEGFLRPLASSVRTQHNYFG